MIGNPGALLDWLQGSGRGTGCGVVVQPEPEPGLGRAARPGGVLVATGAEPDLPGGDVELDYVGLVANAAHMIASLHADEKRLAFCDSRQLVEELGDALREWGVRTFLSHASLSADERLRSEQAFAESRDCLIVPTSTLELGVDVGRSRPGHPGELPAVGGRVLAADRPDRAPPRQQEELPVPRDRLGVVAVVGRAGAPVGRIVRGAGDVAA